MNQTLEIRQAEAADIEGVLVLYAGLDDEAVLPLDAAQAVWQRFARYPNYHLYVVLDPATPNAQGQPALVGSYALLIMDNLAHCGTPSAIAEDVVVAAARRSQGIGRRMMAHAIEQARQAGCYKLALSSNARRTQAHAFYTGLGFAQHGLSFVIET